MCAEHVCVLLIEDSLEDAHLFAQLMNTNRYRSFPEMSYDIKTVSTMAEAVGMIGGGGSVDVIVVDLLLRGTSANEILALIEDASRKVPTIALTTDENINVAVEAIKHGAQDYLVKTEISGDIIDRAIRYAIERKKLVEEQALIKEELRRSNAELQQFAYIASHDLKEPLRMVSSYLELLRKKSLDNLDDRSKEYLAHARDGARRMTVMIDDLLNYSRVANRANQPASVDMQEVLHTVLRDLREAVEKSNTSVTSDTLPTVLADRTQMVLLLENLISNAIKYRGLESPRVHVSASRSDGEWLFSVQDNGIGIPKEQQGRLFQMFSRLHSRDEYEGTGIGLAVAKKAVERHGGRIWVESEVGKGSTFYFTIPDDGL